MTQYVFVLTLFFLIPIGVSSQTTISTKRSRESIKSERIHTREMALAHMRYLDSLLSNGDEDIFWIRSFFEQCEEGRFDSAYFALSRKYYVFLLKQDRLVDLFLHAKKAVQFADIHPESLGAGYAYNTMGTAYLQIADYPQAIKSYDKSLAHFKALHAKDHYSTPLNNLGYAYFLWGKPEQSLGYNLEAINLLQAKQPSLSRDHNLSFNYSQLAESYAALGGFEKADSIHSIILGLGRKHPGSDFAIISLKRYLHHLMQHERYEELEPFIKEYEQNLTQNPHTYKNAIPSLKLAKARLALERQDLEQILHPDSILSVHVDDQAKKLLVKYAMDFWTFMDQPELAQEIVSQQQRDADKMLSDQLALSQRIKRLINEGFQEHEKPNRSLLFTSPYFFPIIFLIAILLVFFILYKRSLIQKHKESLSELNERFEKQQKELDQFTYITNHDLKEHANTILNFSKLIQSKYLNDFPDASKPLLEIISNKANGMMHSVKGLHQYLLLGSELILERCDINELVGEVEENLAEVIEQKNASIFSDKLPHVKGYQSELYLLFLQLVQNGLVHTRPGIDPEIHISYQEKFDRYIFSVQDNGKGIEPQYQGSIFSLFTHLAEQKVENQPGLGLAIAKKIVELHKGNIWAESKLGEGSIFHFSLRKDLKPA